VYPIGFSFDAPRTEAAALVRALAATPGSEEKAQALVRLFGALGHAAWALQVTCRIEAGPLGQTDEMWMAVVDVDGCGEPDRCGWLWVAVNGCGDGGGNRYMWMAVEAWWRVAVR
jgi:hypothetical protein